MPKVTAKRLGVSNMAKCSKMVDLLVKYWTEQKDSKTTAHWALSLKEYVEELLASDKVGFQMDI